jgi:tetratricopeptide (TPR) repeat protein/tRNA A-37 threonylcarbamoyl transferase component Bud32
MVCSRCGQETPALVGRCIMCGTLPTARGPAGTTETLSRLPDADDVTRSVYNRFASVTGGVTEGAPAEQPAPAESDGPLVPGQDFGSRYHIIKILGAGGMGAVYQAWDEELGVAVALKVIRPDVMRNPDSALDVERRFKRELLLARQVTHKHVVRIHDLGELEGIKYITMSFLQGADLGSVLKRIGKLSPRAALAIARQVVSGLRAAHDAGVVHRDLKPANIMIEDDQAVILDFGIARLETAIPATRGSGSRVIPPTAQGFDQTSVGTIVGTLRYMAPEQARGETVDHRADIYAFGLILRDMLLGERRVSNDRDSMAELSARMAQKPPAARSIDPELPDALDQIISRCLEPDQGARYQALAELAADLDRLDENGEPLPVRRTIRLPFAVAGGVAAAGLVALTWWYAPGPTVPVAREPMPVLVADFENRSGDSAFEGSVEQTLTLALEGAPYITVFRTRDARSIAAELAPGKGDRITEEIGQLIARREGLKVLLAGSIDSQGGGYRVEVRATDPATGKAIASIRQTVGDKAQVLSTIASMAIGVREALGESKTEMGTLAAAETMTAASLDAMRAYARAQELTLGNKSQEALQEYERAVQLDPGFGRAYAGMANIYFNYFKDPDKAEGYYQAALQHVDRMTEREKYRTLGTYYLNVVQNHDKAIENYEALVKLFPADDGGHGNLALAYLKTGNLPRAVEEVRKTLEIYPRNSLQRYNYAMYAMYAGDFATAIDEATRVQRENPTFEYASLPIALSQLAQGDAVAARDTYSQLAQLSPLGASFARLGEGDMQIYFGELRAAIRGLREGIAADTRRKSSSDVAQKYVALAEGYLALGERTSAADAAAEAIKLSRLESTLFPAARVLLQAGREERALQVAADLEKMLQQTTTAYARLITGEVAVRRGRLPEAIEAFRDAQKRHDSWFSRFLLGKAYVEAGHFAEGLAELELCVKRRGETTDVFTYDMPTLRYLPPAYYWLARAQEGVAAKAAARENYDLFLKLRTGADPGDALAADAARRLRAVS